MNTMKILYASAPECEAEFDGVKKTIVILKNEGGSMLIDIPSEKRKLLLKTAYGRQPNTYIYEVEGEIPTGKFSVTVTNSSTAVTAVATSPASVDYGGTATFTLTFASGKSASDITVSGGTVSGTTLTVANVTGDKAVTISDAD